MSENIQGLRYENTLPPPSVYQKYQYEVEIDGKKQTAFIEQTPNGKVTIKLGDGENVETIVTDKKGLMEFNKNFKPKDILYNSKQEEPLKKDEQVYSGKLAQIMRNTALASMLIGNKVNQNSQDLTNTSLMMAQQAQDLHNQAQMMHDQVVQQNIMQMSTPGMGII